MSTLFPCVLFSNTSPFPSRLQRTTLQGQYHRRLGPSGLRRRIPCKMDRKWITVHHMASQITRFFFLRCFVKNQSTGHQYVIWQTYKKQFMLLSTLPHLRCFITHGSRLNTNWTFPMPLKEAIFRFMEDKVKKITVFTRCSNRFQL